MPIYEYKCENGHVFDVMQKLAEDPLTSCVECGAPVRKVLHPVGISFKGSGFYSTDYSKKSPTETATKDASTSTNGDKGSKDKKEKANKDNKEKSESSASSGKKD
jgi:putative FmdB family regulatory protein